MMSGFYQQWSGLGEFFKIGAGGVEKVEPLYISKVGSFLVFSLDVVSQYCDLWIIKFCVIFSCFF